MEPMFLPEVEKVEGAGQYADLLHAMRASGRAGLADFPLICFQATGHRSPLAIHAGGDARTLAARARNARADRGFCLGGESLPVLTALTWRGCGAAAWQSRTGGCSGNRPLGVASLCGREGALRVPAQSESRLPHHLAIRHRRGEIPRLDGRSPLRCHHRLRALQFLQSLVRRYRRPRYAPGSTRDVGETPGRSWVCDGYGAEVTLPSALV